MTARDEILQRIKEAIRDEAPPAALPEWKPPGEDIPVLLDRFRAELEAVHGTFVDGRGRSADQVRTDYEKPNAGVVEAAFGLADTGSVVLDHDGDQAPSLLPEESVVILRESQLIASLDDMPPPRPEVRSRIIITGPSRTADIEKRLVLGAHGPLRLVVVLV